MKKTIAMLAVLCLMLTALCVSASADGAYQVQTVDEQGNPIQGVTVQFCSEIECMVGKTGEDGIAAFDAPAGTYTIHLLKVPAGYEKDSREYPAPASPELVTLTVYQEGAADQTVAADDSDSALDVDAPELGLHFVTPEKLRNLKGTLEWGASYLDDGILNISVEYYAIPQADFDDYAAFYEEYADAYINGETLPEAPDPSWMSGYERAILYDFYTLEGGSEQDLRELLEDYYGIGEEWIYGVTEIGADGDCRFFLVQYAFTQEEPEQYKAVMGEYYDEFEALMLDKDSFLSGLTLKAPEWLHTLEAGETIAFETTDLAGNPVDSAKLFAESKVTVINCWATWCGPCKGELPELGEMAKELEAQDCRIVGLCMDAYDDELAETAEALLKDAGAEYLNLRGSDEIDELLQLQAYPTTFLVDSEGKILVEPIIGAYLDSYRTAIAECLALVG